MTVFITENVYISCISDIRRPNMATKGTSSNSGKNYAGQNSHRGPEKLQEPEEETLHQKPARMVNNRAV